VPSWSTPAYSPDRSLVWPNSFYYLRTDSGGANLPGSYTTALSNTATYHSGLPNGDLFRFEPFATSDWDYSGSTFIPNTTANYFHEVWPGGTPTPTTWTISYPQGSTGTSHLYFANLRQENSYKGFFSGAYTAQGNGGYDRHAVLWAESVAYGRQLMEAYNYNGVSATATQAVTYDLTDYTLPMGTTEPAGVVAGRLPVAPFQFTYSDLVAAGASGDLGHMIGWVAANYADGFQWPARAEDGELAAASYLKAGSVIRLSSSWTIPAGWPDPLKALARTLQRYGAVLFDKNSTLADTSRGKAVISSISDPSWPYSGSANTLRDLWTASGPSLTDFEEVDITPLKVADGSIEISSAPPPVGPTASFTATPTSGTAPLTVAFNSTGSTPGDAPITGWSWTFGDSGTSTSQNPSHTYATPGTYTVNLTVTDSNALTDAAPPQTITVSAAPPPGDCDAQFEFLPDTGAINLVTLTPSATMTLTTAGLSAGDPMFIWSRSRDNAAAGSGTITLNGPAGWTQVGTTVHTVDSGNHDHALAVWWKPYVVGDTTATISYSGGTAYAIAVQTNFVRMAGTSAAAITVTPVGETAATSPTFTASPFAITESQHIINISTACANSTAPSALRPTVTNAQGFANIQGQANTQVQVFDKVQVTPTPMSVTMPSLAVPSPLTTAPWMATTFAINHCIAPPVASFTATPTSGLVNLSVAFNDTSTAGDFPITSWYWDFGDGGTSTLQNPTHTYTTGGTYNVTLTVTDSEGFTDTSAPTAITAEEPVCSITLTSGPTSAFAPSTIGIDVDLSDFSTGSWSWDLDWGDGTLVVTDPLVPGVIPLTHTYTAGIGPTSIVVRVYTEPGHAQYTTCVLEVPIYSPCDITPLSTAEIYAINPGLLPGICVGGLGFTVGGFYDYTITFVWGDGTSETIPLSGAITGEQAHIYPGPGTYNVIFTQTIGDDVQVCGPVEVVVDCPEPPGPCPPLLCSPTITWVDSSYDGFEGGNPLTLGPSSFRVDYEDSLNCGGTNENIQLGFAIGTVTAPEATTLGVQLAGQVEWENFGFDQVTISVQRPTDLGYVLVGSCISRELAQGCVMGAPQLLSIGEAASCYSDDLLFGVDIPVGTTTIKVEFSTNDGRFHQGAWETATFTSACECPPPVPQIPDTNCLPGATLGVGSDLRVFLTNRGATQIIAELMPTSGFFTRDVDATSECEVTGTIPGLLDENCCEGWAEIYPWVTELYVWRDGRDAWSGPVTEVTFNYGSVSVRAADLTAWWDRRTLPNLSYKGEDLATIFTGVATAAMSADPVPNFTVSATPVGIFADRTYVATDYKYAKDVLDELAKTGIDWTVYGRTVLVGGETVPAQPYLTLLDDFWTTPPAVKARGNDQATRVIVKGKGVTGAATATTDYLNAFGLLVRVFDENTIEDQATATRAANSRLAILKDQNYIETPSGAALAPSAPITVPELIPGIRVRVATEATCRPLTGDFRLKKVKVDFGGQVSIDLQPLGTDPATDSPKYAKMVVIGDSISAWSEEAALAAGKGESWDQAPSNRWQDLLLTTGKIGYGWDGSRPGFTTRSALATPIAPFQSCDLLVVFLGANDQVYDPAAPASWILPAEYEANLRLLLDKYPADKTVIVFPWRWNASFTEPAVFNNQAANDARRDQYLTRAAAVAADRNAAFVNLGLTYNAPVMSGIPVGEVPLPAYLCDPLIHSSTVGHAGIAALIQQVV
jgi:PKD repeat protein